MWNGGRPSRGSGSGANGRATGSHESRSTGRLSQLEAIHRRKTGRLLCSAVTLGSRIARANSAIILRLEHFGNLVGLAFQIADDLLDVTGNADKLGKGKGAARTPRWAKMTYPAAAGSGQQSTQGTSIVIDEACRKCCFAARENGATNWPPSPDL